MQTETQQTRSPRRLLARFDHDEQGRLVVRMRSLQLYASTAVAVATLFSILLGAVAFLARPYLESVAQAVVRPEVHRLEGSILTVQRGLDERVTRREFEESQAEILRRLDLIAGEIRRVDERIQTQSDRTDALYGNLVRSMREGRPR